MATGSATWPVAPVMTMVLSTSSTGAMGVLLEVGDGAGHGAAEIVWRPVGQVAEILGDGSAASRTSSASAAGVAAIRVGPCVGQFDRCAEAPGDPDEAGGDGTGADGRRARRSPTMST